MCGIYLGEEEDNKIINMVASRGKDLQKSVKINRFFLFSSVLAIRDKIEQPIITENFSFLYNGEIYNETVSDTLFIKETIEDVLLHFKHNQQKIQEISMDIYKRINKYENELALVILFKDYILFFKDDIGRKSLGHKLNKLQISSVGYQNEVDCLYLYIYDIKEKSLQKVLKQSDYVQHLVSNYHRIAHMIQQNKYYAFLKQENFKKGESLINENCSVHDLDKLLFESTKKRLIKGNIVVLFSGGIDSNVIVLYLILASKSDQKIFLINSSLIDSQDRENAKTSYNLIKKTFPERAIELVIVELNCEMIKTHKKHLEDLIYPKTSKMDLNIA
ncbi:asparagine synthetase, partial [Nosema bombycis CQ1]